MIDPQIQAWLDQEDEMVAQTIRKHGLFIQFVAGSRTDTPSSFAYTVGLFGLGHPELVVCSTSPETAHGLLNELGDRIRAGENFIAGQLVIFDDWSHRITIEEIPNPGEIVLCANRHYQRPPEVSVPAYQLTYDDRSGKFPWDAGYGNAANLQPRPGTWTA